MSASRHRAVPSGWPAALALFVGGCGTSPGCDICTTSAVVYGRITQGGTAVAGAAVKATPYANGCAGQLAGNDAPALTDAAGRYRVQPRSGHAPYVACVRVRALSGSGAEATVESAPVNFRGDFRSRDRDSVRVDVALPSP